VTDQLPSRPQPATHGSPEEASDLSLLRRYEPILRYTQGELFLPMSVDVYLYGCGLWRGHGSPSRSSRRRQPTPVCRPGEVTTARLSALGSDSGGSGLFLRYVDRPLNSKEYRAWRKDPARPHRTRGRGLLGRLIDVVLRASLVLRGRVPGGTAAAAQRKFQATTDPDRCPYYGRVARDGGYLVLQYWFLYAMNDWRSTFGGVNDHEADWEQITLFLPDPPEMGARPTWVAFSSHDEVGDDLRRRSDDPDIEWQGEHPVVFAGAGSHSGAYLPGDYLVSVEPPALERGFAAVRRVARVLLPWSEHPPGSGFGIPFIDYRRGDGPGIGPGEDREWSPVFVSDETPWVHDYRGLWGLDTGDPFGGERAPAGPRYERDGSVRLCWSDPVAWAGLDGEEPSPAARRRAVDERIIELDGRIATVDEHLQSILRDLRRARVGQWAREAAGPRPDSAALSSLTGAADQARHQRQELHQEREALVRAAEQGLPPEGPHAHLRHRALPDVDQTHTRRRVLQVWSAFSASFLLAGFAVILLGHFGGLVPAFTALVLITLCIEAFARGHLVRFLSGVMVIALIVAAAWLGARAASGNWRPAVSVLLLAAAAWLILSNSREFFRRR
jgi:hypothetical protein